jgi:hypothetical protein
MKIIDKAFKKGTILEIDPEFLKSFFDHFAIIEENQKTIDDPEYQKRAIEIEESGNTQTWLNYISDRWRTSDRVAILYHLIKNHI